MLDSVRVRLTLWYSLVLAFILICLAVFTYFLYRHNALQRTDSDIAQLSDAFITTLNAELANENGPNGFRDAATAAMQEHRFRETYFALLDSSGHLILTSLDLPNLDNSRTPLTADFFSSKAFQSLLTNVANPHSLRTIAMGKDHLRVFLRALSAGGNVYDLVVVQSLHAQRELMEDIRNTFLWAIPIALLLSALGGYFLARKSLAPIASMASQARGMGAANLHQRLSVSNERDELGQLAQTFNALLERLENSFEQQRRFMADASHELRTPVAILRGEAEVTLSRAERSPAEYRETLSILQEESQRLAHIIEDLFTLARADAGQYPLTPTQVHLDEVAAEALVRARSLAASKRIHLTSAIEPNLPLFGDKSLLGRMLLNLLDNAIKYSPPDATVALACGRSGDNYVVSVSDNGPGIPKELQPRIFERFFRADKARSRSDGDTGGAGLGLSIARWIAEAHQGQLILTCSADSGSTFTATLPAMRTPAPSAD